MLIWTEAVELQAHYYQVQRTEIQISYCLRIQVDGVLHWHRSQRVLEDR